MNKPAKNAQDTEDREEPLLLASFRRSDTEQFRVTLAVYNGNPYISLRIWAQNPETREWYPCRGRGVSIRVSEASAMIGALEHVMDMKERNVPPFISLFEDREPMPTAGGFYPRIFDTFTGPTFDDV